MVERWRSPRYDVAVKWSFKSCEEISGWGGLIEKHGENTQGAAREVVRCVFKILGDAKGFLETLKGMELLTEGRTDVTAGTSVRGWRTMRTKLAGWRTVGTTNSEVWRRDSPVAIEPFGPSVVDYPSTWQDSAWKTEDSDASRIFQIGLGKGILHSAAPHTSDKAQTRGTSCWF